MKRLLSVGILGVLGMWILFVVPTLLYPTHYKDLVYRYSEAFSLDPALVFGVIKAESQFNPRATSHKGARGLMQIMYPTSQMAEKDLQLKGHTEESLYDPERNIQIGCWYLSALISEYQSIPVALAAYNAGGGRVRNWFADLDYRNMEREALISRIGFSETRFYVRSVLNHYKMYQAIYK
jgi:soluble lytic murein transglycosylase